MVVYQTAWVDVSSACIGPLVVCRVLYVNDIPD